MPTRSQLPLWLILSSILAGGLWLSALFFQPSGELQRGRVVEIVQETSINLDSGATGWQQQVQVSGTDRDGLVSVGSEFQPLQESQKLSVGQEVIFRQDAETLSIQDTYRLGGLAALFGVFVLLVVALTGGQGLTALLGMFLTFASLLGGLLPWLLSGGDAFLGASVWAVAVATCTIYLSHGFTRTSHLALISILAVLGVVGLLSVAAVQSLVLTGLGSEEAMFLQAGQFQIPLQGVFLAGILLGVLGILDDICLAQVALVEELFAAKPNIGLKELWQRSLRVGRTHVVSLVNTLILAYASANLPLFLLFLLNQAQQPWWVTLNSEMIVEELVRTLAGSIGLVLAVPISSALASFGLLHLPGILPEKTVKKTTSFHHH